MKEYKVFIEIDGKTREIYVYADGFEYRIDTGVCAFMRGKGEKLEHVALFVKNVKAIIQATEECKKHVLEMAKEN